MTKLGKAFLALAGTLGAWTLHGFPPLTAAEVLASFGVLYFVADLLP